MVRICILDPDATMSVCNFDSAIFFGANHSEEGKRI